MAYADVLATPRARWVTLGGLIGRFREAGTGLALVLTVREVHGSFALAGLASAAYLAGAALTRPLHGRWVDRAGAHGPLLVASGANALSLLTVAVAAALSAGAGVLIALSVLVGLSLPALSAVLRAMWPRLAPGAGEHAYAVDTLSYEMTLVLSPALVGLLAGVTRAWVALVVIAVMGLIGTAVVAGLAVSVRVEGVQPVLEEDVGLVSGSSSGLDRTPKSAVDTDDPRSPTAGASVVRLLIAVGLFIGAAEGAMTVLAPGVASATGHRGASGLLLAALSAGCLAGAAAYGPLSRVASLTARLTALTAALGVALVLLALLGTTLAGFAACAAGAGLALSPTITASFVAIRRAASPGALTETFTWASFAASAGAAGAQALCGVLISGPGVATALWLPVLVTGAALVGSLSLRRLAGPQWSL